MKRRELLLAAGGVLAGCGTPPTLVNPPQPSKPQAMNQNPGLSNDASARLSSELSALVDSPTQPLASLAVCALRAGDVVYANQFGRAYIHATDRALDRPAHAESLYRIASISKLVTTLGVMRLVEDGRLALDADVSDYAGFRLRNPHFPDARISLRMLLAHTSSMRDDGGYYWEAKLQARMADVLLPGGKHYGQGAMWSARAKPGAYFQYANLPWGVIGGLMESVTGERFDRLMKRLVLDPLQLPGGFHPADFSRRELGNTATLYRKRKTVGTQEIWEPNGPWIAQVDDYLREAPVPRAYADYQPGSNGTLFGPQGNCRLSALGLARLMRCLMDGGRHAGKQVFRQESIAEMLKTQWRYADAGHNGNANGESGFGHHKELMNAWGLGVHHFLDLSGPGRGDRLVEGGGFKAVGHLGDAWGLTAAFAFDPNTRHGLIYLIGGPGFNPEAHPGQYSSLYRQEEKILTALWRGVMG